jgi:hypothetical protein
MEARIRVPKRPAVVARESHLAAHRYLTRPAYQSLRRRQVPVCPVIGRGEQVPVSYLVSCLTCAPAEVSRRAQMYSCSALNDVGHSVHAVLPYRGCECNHEPA